MKKTNKKKGFTIVELVIVIAVIAILAAVLIPTFNNVVEKANKSAALQEARNAYTELLVLDPDANISVLNKVDAYIKSGNYWFEVNEGKLTETTAPAADAYGATKPTLEAGATDKDFWLQSSVVVKDGAAYVYTLVDAE